MKLSSLPKSFGARRLPRIIVLGFLLIIVGIGAVPNYFSGNWSWNQPPAINLKPIKALRDTGLELPKWQTLEQQTVRIGGHRWSWQLLEGDYPKPVHLLLLPQNEPTSQPQVEWVDIDGKQRWQTDSYTTLKFTVNSADNQQPSHVTARFFRAWNQRQTFAVLQWYAWSGGGHPAPTRWFWRDQIAQLRRQRVRWVAVSLQIPIEPLGELEVSRPTTESLAKMVQIALLSVFRESA